MAFTDYFNNPLNAGDDVVYPAYYGSSACLAKATIDRVVALVQHPTASDSLCREDHMQKKDPTELRKFRSTTGWGQNQTPIPDEHRFVLVVRPYTPALDGSRRYGRRHTVENIRNVIVVPKD